MSTNLDMPEMNVIKSAADYASQQNDRYLFIVTLLIFLFAGIWVWRWMVADREKLATRLTEITDKHIESTQQLATVVANNTTALQEVKDCMRSCKSKQP